MRHTRLVSDTRALTAAHSQVENNVTSFSHNSGMGMEDKVSLLEDDLRTLTDRQSLAYCHTSGVSWRVAR